MRYSHLKRPYIFLKKSLHYIAPLFSDSLDVLNPPFLSDLYNILISPATDSVHTKAFEIHTEISVQLLISGSGLIADLKISTKLYKIFPANFKNSVHFWKTKIFATYKIL